MIFLENGPLVEKFSKFFYERINLHTDRLVFKFAKFGRLEIDKIVRCLPDKKKQNFALLFRSSADRAQNLQGPAPDNLLRVFQFSFKSVHFRRSYIRTREHRQKALESESNIRLKPSFEPNNK